MHTRILVTLVSATSLALPLAVLATPADPAAVPSGAKAYYKYCVSCHGVEGDGRGPSADYLDPRPRNFQSGIFKFRSTPSGELPTDADMLRTIQNGLHGTYMPTWRALTSREQHDLVQFLKTLSPRFTAEPQGNPMPIPARPAFTPELVAKGKEVWGKMQCAACHGDGGKGDGGSASTLKDDWGYPITPKDFTRGPLKSGDTPEDLFRTFQTGLSGSPMPSFAESITVDESWALVAFVQTLRKS
jgi:mono/diheme cytochrome c family protein